MQSYKDLIVWQKAIQLVVKIYSVTGTFPREELYGLVSQMRRAAVSIPSNIAEGSRRIRKDQKQFFRIAYGSGSELETHIEISKKLGFVSHNEVEQVEQHLNEVLKMLNSLMRV